MMGTSEICYALRKVGDDIELLKMVMPSWGQRVKGFGRGRSISNRHSSIEVRGSGTIVCLSSLVVFIFKLEAHCGDGDFRVVGVKVGGPAHSKYSELNSSLWHLLTSVLLVIVAFSDSNSVSEVKILRCLRQMKQGCSWLSAYSRAETGLHNVVIVYLLACNDNWPNSVFLLPTFYLQRHYCQL